MDLTKVRVQHYATALLKDLYLLQQQVLGSRPFEDVGAEIKIIEKSNLFTTLLPAVERDMQRMVPINLFDIEDMPSFMLMLHCPTLKDFTNLVPEDSKTGDPRPLFTTEHAKELKQKFTSASMPQLVQLAVTQYRCGGDQKPHETLLYYLPDVFFNALSPYIHVIHMDTTFDVGWVKDTHKYCMFSNRIPYSLWTRHAEHCAALELLFPATVPLSVKYQVHPAHTALNSLLTDTQLFVHE
jgi:hypothetical protein